MLFIFSKALHAPFGSGANNGIRCLFFCRQSDIERLGGFPGEAKADAHEVSCWRRHAGEDRVGISRKTGTVGAALPQGGNRPADLEAGHLRLAHAIEMAIDTLRHVFSRCNEFTGATGFVRHLPNRVFSDCRPNAHAEDAYPQLLGFADGVAGCPVLSVSQEQHIHCLCRLQLERQFERTIDVGAAEIFQVLDPAAGHVEVLAVRRLQRLVELQKAGAERDDAEALIRGEAAKRKLDAFPCQIQAVALHRA